MNLRQSYKKVRARLNKPVLISKRWPDYVFVFFLCLGIFLRLGPLVHKDLWQDELFSISFASKEYSPLLHILHPLDDRPPLFYLFVKTQLLFSHDKIFLRLPSLLSSTAVIAIVYVMFRKKHPGIALTLTAMATLSPYLISFSWQVRDYGLMLSITALAIYILYQQLLQIEAKKKISWRAVSVYVFLTLIGCLLNYIYFVYSFILLFMLGVLGVWLFRKKNLFFADYYRKLFLLHIPVFSLVFQYLLIQRQTIEVTTAWIPSFSWQALTGYIATIGGVSYAFETILKKDEFTYLFQSIAVVIVLIIGSVLFIRQRKRYSQSLQLLVWLSFSVFIATTTAMYVLGKLTHTSLFLTKTFVPVAVFFLIGYGVVLTGLIKKVVTNSCLLLIVGSTLGAVLSYQVTTEYLYNFPLLLGDEQAENHQSYTDAMKVLLPLIDEGTQLVILPHGSQPLIMDYYFYDKKGKIDRFATFLETKATNQDVPLNHVRPYISMRKVVLLSNSTIFSPEASTRYYLPSYLKTIVKIRTMIEAACGGKLKLVQNTSQHTIEMCEVMVKRSDQVQKLQQQIL